MKHISCPLSEHCDSDCLPYLKTCLKYKKYLVALAVKKTGIKFSPDVEKHLQNKSVSQKKHTQTVSSTEALAMVILTIIESPSQLKAYNYHTAVAAGLEEELPSENVIFINSVNKYFDSSKQYQVIASFISKLLEAGKTVIHLSKQDFIS